MKYTIGKQQSIKKSKVNSANTASWPIFYESNEYTKEEAENNMEAIDRAASPELYYATIILEYISSSGKHSQIFWCNYCKLRIF